MGEQALEQAREPRFPHPTEAVSLGWHFFKANVGITLAYVGISTATLAAADALTGGIDDNANAAPSVGLALLALALVLLGSLFDLVMWRRGLDYWDETHGLAKRRSGWKALGAAVDGAVPRVLPYIGWALLLTTVIILAMIAAVVISALIGVGAAEFTVIIMIALFYLIDFLSAFYGVAAADGPGNPLTRSFHVFRHHFWRIVGTYLLYGIGVIIAVLPIVLVGVLLGGTAPTRIFAGLVTGVGLVIVQGMMTGTLASMYRTVFPPAVNAPLTPPVTPGA